MLVVEWTATKITTSATNVFDMPDYPLNYPPPTTLSTTFLLSQPQLPTASPTLSFNYPHRLPTSIFLTPRIPSLTRLSSSTTRVLTYPRSSIVFLDCPPLYRQLRTTLSLHYPPPHLSSLPTHLNYTPIASVVVHPRKTYSLLFPTTRHHRLPRLPSSTILADYTSRLFSSTI
jgi:hypothetical protein